jgi:transposase-like protein
VSGRVYWAREHAIGSLRLEQFVMTELPIPLTALSEAQRAQATQRFTIIRSALEDGVTQTQVASAHNISVSTVRRWVKRYREKGLAGLADAKVRSDKGKSRSLPPDAITLIEVFYSYAHEDQALRDELEKHLSILHRHGLISSWHDRKIVAGTDFAKEIDAHLETASLILLLVSSDFLASDYCYGIEMKHALERHKTNEAQVIPILLRPIAWKGAPFEHLQVLPTNAKPITLWSNLDEGFADVVTSIRQVLSKSVSFSISSSTSAASPVLEPYFAHPYPLQESFTGRIYERQMLTEWFINPKHPILALIALGGMGKSSLAWVWVQHDILNRSSTELALQMTDSVRCSVPQSSFPEGIFWWSFYEHESSFPAFLEEVLAYAKNEKRNPSIHTSPYENVKSLILLLQQRRLLLVLDGLERELRAYASLSAAYTGDGSTDDSQEDVRACTNPHLADFLRGVAALPLKSHILLTSRHFPRELDGVNGCRRVELTGLKPEDAVAFFHAQGVQGPREEIEKIGTLLGYHPLALRLLAGHIRDDPAHPGDLTVAAEYLSNLNLVQRKHHVLALAYETLHPLKRELLSRLAAFRSQTDFHLAKIVSPFQTDKELKEALLDLIARGLLSFDRQRGRYDLHPIVRQYAYDRLIDKPGVHGNLRDYFASLAANPQLVQHLEDLAPVIELYHHTVSSGQYDKAFQVYNERIRFPLYYELGEYELDIQLLDAIPRMSNGIPTLSSHETQFWVLLYAVMTYERMGRAKIGLRYAEKALQVAQNAGDMHNVGRSLMTRSMTVFVLGRLQQASESLREAIHIFEPTRIPYWTGNSHRLYGYILMHRGDFLGALKHFELAEKAYGPPSVSHYGYTVLLLWRTQLSLLQGDPIQAHQMAQRARDRSLKGSLKPEVVKALWLLGVTQMECELLVEAHMSLTEALTECRRIRLLEVEADIMLSLARWHNAVDRREQAWEYAKEALAIADRAGYRLQQADIQNVMAQMALEMQDHDAAYRYAQAAYHIAWCDGSPYCYKPALEKAEQLLRQAHNLRERHEE